MLMSFSLYISKSLDVYNNLALETYLLEKKSPEAILFLWQNEKTVVIGKNQSAYKECSIQKMKNDGVKLARRITGGGAVYHHLGNLNFSFILPNEIYNTEDNFKIIISALKNLNINAKLSGRNDITICDKKFSGNAFFKTKTHSLHHGTILINEDLSILSKYLNVNPTKLKTKGVSSIKSRVINLSSINRDLNLEIIIEQLIKEYTKRYGNPTYQNLPNEDKFYDIFSKYSSREWVFGQNPNTNIEFTTFLSCGEFTVNIDIKNDVIKYIKIYSDSLNTDLPKQIENALLGKQFIISNLEKELIHILNDKDIKLITNEIKKIF